MPSPPQSRAAFAATCALLLAASAAALLAGCSSQGDEVAGFVGDKQSPTVAFDTASAARADSAVGFTLNAADNLDIARVRIDVSGGVQASVDSAVRASSTTKLSMAFSFPVPRAVPAGTPVKVVARVRDGAGNETTSDTLRLSVGNVPAPTVALTSPAPASLFVTGKRTTLTLVAASPLKVRTVGYRVSGPFAGADSVTFAASAERDSAVVVDTLDVPAGAPAGILTIRPFVVDGAGRLAEGAAVTFAVQSVANTDTRPVVSAGFGPRLEVTDTLRVTASDPVGLRNFGYEVLLRADTARRVGADSVVLADAALTNDARRFTLRLDTALLAAQPQPARVFVRAFATNAAGRRTAAALNAAGASPDTALVVAGATTPLPDGGRLADGLYTPKYDRLYLTNIDRNRLEVFDLAGRRFLGGVAVGSRPWGLAPWPAGRDGSYGDTLFVANSGGTNVSYVDLARGGSAGGAEVFRYALPNIIAKSVTTERLSSGLLQSKYKEYDFSDRPQFLATTCGGDLATGRCDEPILVYSTTPTRGQTDPFPNMGTVRWENLKQRTSHFFFEQAADRTSQGSIDTLRVERWAAGGVGADSLLVPERQPMRDPVSGAIVGSFSVEVDVAKLAFRDTTFVRNSGNFARAVIGEGGPVLGSRAIAYDATRGLEPTASKGLTRSNYLLETPVYDRGVSRAGDVSDFIANTFSRVMGVAINFDGALAAVRGDSTYLIDPTLRLQGLLQTSGGPNAGFDFHPLNATARAAAGARFAFSASHLPQIEIYDTWCYQRVRTIEVREPIVGPIRATRRPLGGGRFELVIVGASARGVTVVSVAEPIASSCP
jgi:hypothetical protein